MVPSRVTKSLPTQKITSTKIEGKKEISEDFVLFFKKRPGTFKLTIVITKKIAPKAVDRNRIKRLIKEALIKKTQIEGEMKIIVKNNMSGLKLDDISKKLEFLVGRTK